MKYIGRGRTPHVVAVNCWHGTGEGEDVLLACRRSLTTSLQLVTDVIYIAVVEFGGKVK